MPRAHPHLWFTISRHHSAEGEVAYRRCPCGRWETRVDGVAVSGPLAPCRRLYAPTS